MRKPFNFIQAAILKALTEALFHDVEMAIPATQVVANLQRQFALVVGGKAKEIGLSLYLLCLVMGGPFFLVLGPEWRARRVKKRLMRTKNNLMQDLARLRSVVYAGYYGHWQGEGLLDNEADQRANRDNPVLRQIAFTLPVDRDRGAPGEAKIKRFDERDLTEADMLREVPEEAGVIVIGSGAGGAVAAAELAAQGHDVLIVEAGPFYPTKKINHREWEMTARLFVDGGVQTSRDHDIVVFQGRVVGGSTVINNGICLRVNQRGMTHPAAPDVFAQWAALGAPVDRARFEAAYGAIESRLSVAQIEARAARHNGPHLQRGWSAHAAATGDPRDLASPRPWFRKNYGPNDEASACVYCGYCNTGCPYGRKQGMAQSFLIDAHKARARILPDTSVKAIRWETPASWDRRRATGVEAVGADGRRHFIRAREGVVVAAGALASSRILDASGIDGTGTGISLNIACPVVALMPGEQSMRVWDEDQMATYVDHGDFLLESHFQPPMSMSTLMPGWFGEHARRMRNYGRLASAGVLIPADRRGRIIDSGLSFKLRDDVELPLLRQALAALTRVHFAAGAEEVYPALARGQILRPGEDIDRFFAHAIREADDVTLSSSHPQGGNARGVDRAHGVVDLDCRVHGTANVLVTDASTFSSCIRVNAQLTTMAMAHYATAIEPF
ncbi:MAG: GMC family oxidoreductase [Sphingomonas bacterium]